MYLRPNAVPKSISLYLSLNDDQDLERMVQDAYTETMKDIENEIEVQVHKKGEHDKEVSGNLVYASFVHRETSRWTGFRTRIITSMGLFSMRPTGKGRSDGPGRR
jgi:TrwC relaxase